MRNQATAPIVRRHESRPCLRCGVHFTPTHGLEKYDRECARLQQIDFGRNRRSRPERAKAKAHGKPRKPLIRDLAPDFLRAFPELVAELDRVAPLGSKLTARDYRSVPLTELGRVRDRRGE